jgi:UDP-GlcNAc:undecaprenyl-phosphate GlcNAc-1-phosphate transferase
VEPYLPSLLHRASPAKEWSPGLLVSSALFGFFISCVLALLATPLARRAGVAMGWRDRPDDAHKVHRAARPYAGGMAVLATVSLSLFIFRFAFREYADTLDNLLLAIAPGALLIAAVGLLDDLRGCRPIEKLVVQGVAILLFQSSAFVLGFADGSTAGTGAVIVAAILLNCWMLGLTNAMNLIDGMDGLAAGLAATSALAMSILGLLAGDAAIATIAAILAGASLGFRRSNRSPARIYLGDGGSLLLGFGLSATGAAVWLHHPGIGEGMSLILITWVPLVDTGTTILRRMFSGVALFQADRDHLHHRLLARGRTTRTVGRHLIGLNLVGIFAGLGIHAGMHPAAMFGVTLAASVGVLRAALPLKVTIPVQRPEMGADGPKAPAGTQERAA